MICFMNLYWLVRQVIALTRTLSIINDFLHVSQKVAVRIDIVDHTHL